MIKTWAQLYDRLGRQPLFITRQSLIILHNEDMNLTPKNGKINPVKRNSGFIKHIDKKRSESYDDCCDCCCAG